MKITSFNPVIVTKDPEAVVGVFEALGFEKKHNPTGTSSSGNQYEAFRMKDANGFHVDVSRGDGEWTMVRMNVDNLEEAIAFLEARGFHKARHAAANETVDTGSSRFNIMVSATGFIFAVSQHTKDND